MDVVIEIDILDFFWTEFCSIKLILLRSAGPSVDVSFSSCAKSISFHSPLFSLPPFFLLLLFFMLFLTFPLFVFHTFSLSPLYLLIYIFVCFFYSSLYFCSPLFPNFLHALFFSFRLSCIRFLHTFISLSDLLFLPFLSTC